MQYSVGHVVWFVVCLLLGALQTRKQAANLTGKVSDGNAFAFALESGFRAAKDASCRGSFESLFLCNSDEAKREMSASLFRVASQEVRNGIRSDN